MSQAAPGDRVFAARNATDDVVYLFGHGTYDGYQPITDDPPPDPLPQDVIDQVTRDEVWLDETHDSRMAKYAEQMRDRGDTDEKISAWQAEVAAHQAARPPMGERIRQRAREMAGPLRLLRVTLDGGRGVVYGLQCWWAPEAQYERFVAGRRIELVEPGPLPDWVLHDGHDDTVDERDPA